jgi:hypothetical protein
MIQCKSNELQVVSSENIRITYSPTLVVDSYMVEHQYEGKDSNSLIRIEITNKIESVPQWAFAIVPSLEEVRLSSSVKVVDDNAFFSCNKLSKINLNDVEIIGENCFKFSALEDVNLTSAQDIKEFAFSNCYKLKKIKFSDRLKTIGEFAFSGDSSLINCHIPSGEIGASAFMGCSKMEQISFGKVVSIGNAAFLDCTSLSSVIIPSTMREIGNEAFSGCVNLKKVIIDNKDTKIADNAFPKNVEITYKKDKNNERR